MSGCQRALRPFHTLFRQAGPSQRLYNTNNNSNNNGARSFSSASRLQDDQPQSSTSNDKVKPTPKADGSSSTETSTTDNQTSTQTATEVTDSTTTATTTTKTRRPIDPLTVFSPRRENALIRQGKLPIGSRRRRAAIKSSANIPFDQLPYQCFQDALRVLAEDRKEKLDAIKNTRTRISNLEAKDPAEINGGEQMKRRRLKGLRTYLEELKIQADINDPLIKKKFEDGMGDMTKPIYRYLADRKWRSYQRKIIVQRINQLSVIPDVLRKFEPTAEVRLAFRNRAVQPGEFVDSRVSEVPARLNVQLFDKGDRLLTIAVVDPDVPDIASDNFTSNCHFLAVNVPFGPGNSSLPLSQIDLGNVIHAWLPPYAQKGSPYHRLSVFIMEQGSEGPLSIADIKQKLAKRTAFDLQKFVISQKLKPVGVHVFRSVWDEGTAGVMQRAGIEGADLVFERKKVVAIKPKQKARGWEARHAGPKYAALKVGRNVGKQYK